MTTCANCQNEAIYTYPVSDNFLIHYCQYHLPKFLTNQKRAGQLPLIVEVAVSEPEVSDILDEDLNLLQELLKRQSNAFSSQVCRSRTCCP
jgi:hypothetical protein